MYELRLKLSRFCGVALAAGVCAVTSFAAGAHAQTATLSATQTEAEAHAADIEAANHCFVCHGADARGNPAIGAPSLAALDPDYLQRQLQNYRGGLRGRHERDAFGNEMQPVALQLDDADVYSMSALFAGIPATATAEPTVEGDAERGATLFAVCATCHGNAAEGRLEFGAPRLAGQRDWYLQRQLIAFRDRIRGATDAYSVQMAAAAQMLDDEAVDDVVAYINQLTSHLPMDMP